MISSEKNKEVKSMVQEAFEKFARRLAAVEHYFGVEIIGEWERVLRINKRKIKIHITIEDDHASKK